MSARKSEFLQSELKDFVKSVKPSADYGAAKDARDGGIKK